MQIYLINQHHTGVIIGNKCDTRDDSSVSPAEAREFASNWGLEYFESSAVSKNDKKKKKLQQKEKQINEILNQLFGYAHADTPIISFPLHLSFFSPFFQFLLSLKSGIFCALL
jgi:hypothetical protein